jgi:hypothetical protein
MALDLYSQEEKIPMWKKLLAVFAVLLVVTILTIFTYNKVTRIPQNNTTINSLNLEANKQGTDEQIMQKEYLLKAQKKLNQFKELYSQKPIFNVYFENFQTWLYPRVAFSSATINVKEAQISLKGETDSLQSLMQEMILLDAKDDILSYTLSNIVIGDQGVTFDIKVKINSGLFNRVNTNNESYEQY